MLRKVRLRQKHVFSYKKRVRLKLEITLVNRLFPFIMHKYITFEITTINSKNIK